MTSTEFKESRRNLRRQRRLLERLAVPAFREHAPEEARDHVEFDEADDGETVGLRAFLGTGHLVHAVPGAAIDSERSELCLTLLAGYFVADAAAQAMLVGNLLEPTPFHVQADFHLGSCGQMSIGCDLVVRDDDEPLVRRRLGELVRLAEDLEWFFPLRMPGRIRWPQVVNMEIEWPDLPHGELGEFLDAALGAPAAERTPVTMVLVAMGLLRWKDVLRLLREHPEELPPGHFAPLKVMALRELERWLPALEAGEAGGIEDGGYPGHPWLSPSYMHAMIEAGKDIEALQILGEPRDGEPGFYDWLRGLALHRAGDPDGAAECFDRYFGRWPGDVIGLALTGELDEEVEP